MMSMLDFHVTYKIPFAVHLKHSGTCPSADVKPAPNDLVHTLPWQCNICSLYAYTVSFMEQWVKLLLQDCFFVHSLPSEKFLVKMDMTAPVSLLALVTLGNTTQIRG
jgi:hypothetical protein